MYAEPVYAAVRSENPSNTNRYRAPELQGIDNEMSGIEQSPTKRSDIYSFSMIIVEVRMLCGSVTYAGSDDRPLQLATGKVPFPECTTFALTMALSKKKRPSKPARFEIPGITPGVWKIAEKCWKQNAEERPEVNVVLQDLETLLQTNVCTRGACACLAWELVD